MRAWSRFLRQPQNIVALLFVGLFVGTAVFAPWLSPQPDPENPTSYKNVGERFDRTPYPPSAESWLGTTPAVPTVNAFGFVRQQVVTRQWDVWHTLIWGSREALRFGLTTTLLTATFGVLVGAISGYLGGWIEGGAMRVTDAFLTFPPIAAVWLFQRTLFVRANFFFFEEPPAFTPLQQFFYDNMTPVMLALIVFSWMPYARIINSLVAQIRQAEFVLAAEAMGASTLRIVFRHLLPNTIAPAIVLAARDVGSMVVLESAFAFMGISGTVSWGVMLVASRDYIMGTAGNPFSYWWVFVPVSLAIILFGIGWNLLGDGLNTWLNPRR